MLILNKHLNEEEKTKTLAQYKENFQNYEWRLRATKREMIKRLFLEPADTTYITARWHFFMGLRYEFYWSAYHAIEKYLKAILLFNGRGTIKLGHDIMKAYDSVSDIADADLLPDKFSQPLLDRISHITSMNDMSRLHYDGTKQYICNLFNNGGTNSRYAMKSASVFVTDIYTFDLTIFTLRRLAEDLSKNDTKQALIDNPSHCPARNAFLEGVFSKPGHRLYDITSKVNYFLVPDPDTSKFLNVGFGLAFSNSAIYNNILENNSSDDPMKKTLSSDISKWLTENVKLDKNYKTVIEGFVR